MVFDIFQYFADGLSAGRYRISGPDFDRVGYYLAAGCSVKADEGGRGFAGIISPGWGFVAEHQHNVIASP